MEGLVATASVASLVTHPKLQALMRRREGTSFQPETSPVSYASGGESDATTVNRANGASMVVSSVFMQILVHDIFFLYLRAKSITY